MFKYTTETILNDLTKVKYLLGSLTAPVTGVDWDPGIEAGKKVLFIEKLNKFIVGGTYDAIVSSKIYKRATSAEQLATRSITIPAVTTGALYRIGVQITTNGYTDGQFARDRVTYGKPFYVEIIATETTDTVAATALAAAWNTGFKQYDNFPIASTSGADLVFTAVNNPFVQFKEIILESINTTTGIGTLIDTTVSAETEGIPSFGTYLDLVKHHRLPTLDNYRKFGLNNEELPQPGATYDQYTFEYLTARGNMGQSVVAEGESSLTTHVLWVNTAAADVIRHISGVAGDSGSYAFEEILKAIGITIINAATGATITPATITETGHTTTTTTTTAAPTTTTTTVAATTTTTTVADTTTTTTVADTTTTTTVP
jgi:hypothetical protein